MLLKELHQVLSQAMFATSSLSFLSPYKNTKSGTLLDNLNFNPTLVSGQSFSLLMNRMKTLEQFQMIDFFSVAQLRFEKYLRMIGSFLTKEQFQFIFSMMAKTGFKR